MRRKSLSVSIATMLVITTGAVFATSAIAGFFPADIPPVSTEGAPDRTPETRVRVGIDAMRSAISASGALRSSTATDPARLAELGRALESRVASMIACCTKDGKASRELNALLAEMTDGIALMRGASRPDARRMGLLKVVQALNLYGTMFVHSGWDALDETMEVSAR